MDVIKPWIAERVTEYLEGFEDAVLISFIYALLDEKEVNGKTIQIQLDSSMAKNTSKFMKELWTLLLSAQNNASNSLMPRRKKLKRKRQKLIVRQISSSMKFFDWKRLSVLSVMCSLICGSLFSGLSFLLTLHLSRFSVAHQFLRLVEVVAYAGCSFSANWGDDADTGGIYVRWEKGLLYKLKTTGSSIRFTHFTLQ